MVAFRSVGTVVRDWAQTLEVPAAAGIVNGDVLYICAYGSDNQAITCPEDGFVQDTELQSDLAGDSVTAVFRKIASDESCTYTINLAGGTDKEIKAVMLAYSDPNPVVPQDAVSTTAQSNNTDTHDPAAITTITDGAIVVSVVGFTQTIASPGTQPSGYTKRAEEGSTDYLGVADKVITTAGEEDPGTWSGLGATADGGSITFAIKPAYDPIPIVRSVEKVQAKVDTDSLPEIVNLSKGQDETQCVPFSTAMWESGPYSDFNEELLYTVDFIDNSGVAAIKIVAPDRGTTYNQIIEAFVVEFDSAITVQQVAVTTLVDTVNSVNITVADVGLQTSAFMIFSPNYVGNNDDFRESDVYVEWNGTSTTSVTLTRHSTGANGDLDGTLYVVSCDNGEFTVEHTEINRSSDASALETVTITEVVAANTFLLHSWDDPQNGDDILDSSWHADLQDTTTVRIRRAVGAGTPGVMTSNHRIQVVECHNNEWSVQRDGAKQLADERTTATITGVDRTKSIIIGGHQQGGLSVPRDNSTVGTDKSVQAYTMYFASDTSIAIHRQDGTSTDSVAAYEVVEFDTTYAENTVGHAVGVHEERVLVQSTSYNRFEFCQIAATDLEANTEYMVIVSALVMGADTARNDYHFRLYDGGIVGDSSHRIEARDGNSSTGTQYFWMGRYTTPAVPVDITLQGHTDSTTEVMRCISFYAVAIKLADMDSADWAESENTTNLTTLSSAGWTEGTNITIGDGTSDWIVFGYGRILCDQTGIEIRMRLTDDDVQVGEAIHLEGEDTIEETNYGFMWALPALASSTIALEFQTNHGTTGYMDVDRCQLFALRLNQFEDHLIGHDTTDVEIAVVDTDYGNISVGHTVDTADTRAWMCFGSSVIGTGDDAKKIRHHIKNGSTIIAGDSDDIADGLMLEHNGSTDQLPSIRFAQYPFADAASLTATIKNQENADVSPTPDILDAHIAWFTWQLADPSKSASGTPVLSKVTSAGAAEIEKIASGAPVLTGLTSAGLAEIEKIASGAVQISALTSTGIAEIGKIASGSPTLSKLISAGEVAFIFDASGAPSLAGLTSAGVAEVEKIASGSPTLGKLTSVGVAEIERIASGAPAISKVTSAGVAVVERQTSGAVSLSPLTSAGLAEIERQAGGAAVLNVLTSAGISIIEKVASGSPEISKPVSVGVAETLRVADGSPSISGLTSAGVAELEKIASGLPSIGNVTSTGVAEVEKQASGSPAISKITSAGAAVLIWGASGAPVLGVITSAGTAIIERQTSGVATISAITSAGVAYTASIIITSVSGDDTWEDGDEDIPIVGKGFV